MALALSSKILAGESDLLGTYVPFDPAVNTASEAKREAKRKIKELCRESQLQILEWVKADVVPAWEAFDEIRPDSHLKVARVGAMVKLKFPQRVGEGQIPLLSGE